MIVYLVSLRIAERNEIIVEAFLSKVKAKNRVNQFNSGMGCSSSFPKAQYVEVEVIE